MTKSVNWRDIRLEMTCGACPEQYDAYLGAESVGYLRLRHGIFRVDGPDGDTLHWWYPRGDGMFEPDERERYLKNACKKIAKALESKTLALLDVEEDYS